MKKCKNCREYKALDQFRMKINRGSWIQEAICNDCLKEWFRRWRQKNRVKYDNYQRLKCLRKGYGITQAQYDLLLEVQSGVCAICGELESITTVLGPWTH